MKVYCADCETVRDSDTHGKCAVCGSRQNAPVDRLTPINPNLREREIEQLEKMWYAEGDGE